MTNGGGIGGRVSIDGGVGSVRKISIRWYIDVDQAK